ncbi:MAG: thioredoxin-dependent thiol peroxidase [Chitinophagaceae bacterium]
MAITLKEGDKAPVFSGVDQNGRKVSLADFKGKRLILYFYPQDDTPGCTAEACNLRDHFSVLKKAGFAILGVSPDGVEKHKKFETKYELPFPLLADTEHKVLVKYGVWGKKQMYGKTYIGVLRTTFVIDAKGVIQKIFLKPKTKEHAEEILEACP